MSEGGTEDAGTDDANIVRRERCRLGQFGQNASLLEGGRTYLGVDGGNAGLLDVGRHSGRVGWGREGEQSSDLDSIGGDGGVLHAWKSRESTGKGERGVGGVGDGKRGTGIPTLVNLEPSIHATFAR